MARGWGSRGRLSALASPAANKPSEATTKTTDKAMEHLKGLSQLRVLWLYGTKVTDAGLEHLKGLSQLQVLRLNGTKVTEAGVAKLRKALPKCKIDWP